MKVQFISNGKIIKKVGFSKLDSRQFFIGSGIDQSVDIILPFKTVSRKHATLGYENGQFQISDKGSTNGTFINNIKLNPNCPYNLKINDVISFSNGSELQAIVINDESIGSVNSNKEEKQIPVSISINEALASKDVISIGRDQSCDIVLTSGNVSRRHAEVEKNNGQYIIRDLGSKNGVFINGKKISGSHHITSTDLILIGATKLSINLAAIDIRNEVAIRLINVQKIFPGNKIGLQTINLSIKSKSLVGIMGPSGCGKSTLLKAMTGDSPASSGRVLIHGLDLISHFEYIKTHIGYVPQDDIIHKDLTVQECLFFSGKLRIENADKKYINSRIEKVLSQLNITHTRYQRISSLSGGQRKRVSIAVELLNEPFILFLDEPTSPLDPQSVEEFLNILKRLSAEGTTVVLVTHKPDDLLFLDEVLFLGKDGYPVFFDKIGKHLSYFQVDKTVSIYRKLTNPADPEFQTYFRQFNLSHAATEQFRYDSAKISSKISFGFLRQLFWLTSRYINIKLNDKTNTAILLIQAPAIALLVCLIFDRINLGLMFMMTISAVWFGTNNAAREIITESAIYKRERMYNLDILTYLLSKIIVLTIFTLIQSAMYIFLVHLYFQHQDVPLQDFFNMFIWFSVISVVSVNFGLFISSLCKNNDQVSSILPMALIPQIMLGGVLAKISTLPIELLSYFTVSRWGTEGFSNVQKNISTSYDQTMNDGTIATTNIPASSNVALLDQFHKHYADRSFFGTFTGTLKLDIIALVFITILLFSLTYFFLKKKDSIQ